MAYLIGAFLSLVIIAAVRIAVFIIGVWASVKILQYLGGL